MMREVQSEPGVDVPAKRVVGRHPGIVVARSGWTDIAAVRNQGRNTIEDVVDARSQVQRIVEQRVGRRQIEIIVRRNVTAQRVMYASLRRIAAVSLESDVREMAPLQ